MAVMHPVDIENYDYTPTEKEMYYALKEQLPDKYQVFYSVRWFETVDNKRIDSESDFLIFDPSFGFIALEVKGGTGITVVDGKWTLLEEYSPSNSSSRDLKCSPYEQAEKSMRHFRNYFVSEFNQNYNGVYGFAVAFPRYVISSQLAQDAPPETTIDLNDMTSLRDKVNQIFHYWKNKRNITIPFSAEQRNRFLTAINKQISMSAAAGALIPIKEKEFSKIDFVQDSILDCLHNYRQAQIVGGAGTGKTFIGIKKAVRDILDEKKVLFICCNEELAAFVKSRLSQYPKIDVFTYAELMRSLLGELYDELPTNPDGNKSCFEYMEDVPAEKKYDSISHRQSKIDSSVGEACVQIYYSGGNKNGKRNDIISEIVFVFCLHSFLIELTFFFISLFEANRCKMNKLHFALFRFIKLRFQVTTILRNSLINRNLSDVNGELFFQFIKCFIQVLILNNKISVKNKGFLFSHS